MRRVYLRLWLVTTALSALALVALETALVVESYDVGAAYYNQFVAGGVRATARLHDQGRPVRALEEDWGVDVAVVDGPGAVPGSMATEPGVRWYERADGGSGYLVRSPRGTWLHIGPFAPYPGPDYRLRLLILLGIAGALSGATWLVLRPLDRTQQAIGATAARIGDGDLSARVSPEDAHAAPAVAATLNAMADHIESLVAARQHMLRAASHELRTPIARLRIGVHLLASAPPDERDAREDALDADLAELDELVEDLLLYARMTDPVREPERVAIAVADVLTRQARAEPRLELAADAVVLADPKLFRRALGNLVANARRYADARIRVTSEVCERETCVVVEDDGPGIAEPQHHEALAPFSGLDEQSGHGLGLAIVDEIVRRHGGRLTLGRSGLGGLEVRTWWPHGSG